MRAKASVLNRAIKGEPLVFPDPDPAQVEEEEHAPDPIDPNDPLLQTPELPYGTSAPADELKVIAYENLKATLRDNTPVKSQTREPLPVLPVQIPVALQGKIVHSSGKLVVKGVLTDPERTALVNLDPSTTSPFRVAVERLHVRSQDDELTQLDKLGLEEFIKFLELKINQADDTLDLGFLMTQASMYRLRQIMLGTDAASRLATSPALATIASGSTAAATKQNIAQFFATAKVVSGPIETVAPAKPAAAPAAGIEETPPAAGVEEASPAGGIEEAFPAGMTGTVPTGLLGGTRITDFLSLPRRRSKSSEEGPCWEGSSLRVEEPTLAFETSARPPAPLPWTGPQGRDCRAEPHHGGLRLPYGDDCRAAQEPSGDRSQVVRGRLEVRGLRRSYQDSDRYRRPRGPGVPGQLGQGHQGGLLRRSKRAGWQARSKKATSTRTPPTATRPPSYRPGVKALDSSIGTLRIIEGRVQAYKRALALCRKALAEITALKTQAVQRLNEIEGNLAEARHDVAVARALLAEETKRVDGDQQPPDQGARRQRHLPGLPQAAR